MASPKIVAFAGSTREGSYNKKLIRIAAEAARAKGASVTLIDLRDFAMPLYDGDLEQQEGLPLKALELKRIFTDHDGFLISAPEYNSSITGVLKNSIDWTSRPETPVEKPFAPFAGKAACLMSASPGALGGLRGLVTLRSILGNMQMLVLPEQVAVSKAHEAFKEDGSLKDPKQQTSIEKLGQGLTAILAKLA